MNPFRLQPSFTVEMPWPKQQSIERLRAAIATTDFAELAVSAGSVFDFKIPKEERRFWSPHLSCQLSESESGSQLFARFSPRPEIWTMFIAIYFVIAILMSLAAIVGYVQWSLGYSPWTLAAIPIGTLGILALHAGSLVGQSLSNDQMELLHGRLEQVVTLALQDHAQSNAETSG